MNVVIDIKHNESDFVQACINKEEWALKKLYEDNYSIMLPICMRYAKNNHEALDILHDGFIKVFKNMSKYKPGTSLKSWIKRVMVNTSIDHYRKKVRQRTEDIDSAYYLQDNNTDVVSMMSADEILDALQDLTPTYRTVFNLFVIEGYPHKKIAEILNISESTSRSNLVKARSKLKLILSKRHIKLEQISIK